MHVPDLAPQFAQAQSQLQAPTQSYLWAPLLVQHQQQQQQQQQQQHQQQQHHMPVLAQLQTHAQQLQHVQAYAQAQMHTHAQELARAQAVTQEREQALSEVLEDAQAQALVQAQAQALAYAQMQAQIQVQAQAHAELHMQYHVHMHAQVQAQTQMQVQLQAVQAQQAQHLQARQVPTWTRGVVGGARPGLGASLRDQGDSVTIAAVAAAAVAAAAAKEQDVNDKGFQNTATSVATFSAMAEVLPMSQSAITGNQQELREGDFKVQRAALRGAAVQAQEAMHGASWAEQQMQTATQRAVQALQKAQASQQHQAKAREAPTGHVILHDFQMMQVRVLQQASEMLQAALELAEGVVSVAGSALESIRTASAKVQKAAEPLQVLAKRAEQSLRARKALHHSQQALQGAEDTRVALESVREALVTRRSDRDPTATVEACHRLQKVLLQAASVVASVRQAAGLAQKSVPEALTNDAGALTEAEGSHHRGSSEALLQNRRLRVEEENCDNALGQLPGPVRDALPIDEHRHDIVRRIREQPVTLIQGHSGCGKSSRVPQLVHFYCKDSWVSTTQGERMVVVTQPRCLACVTLARRVASEIGESSVGGVVGCRTDSCGVFFDPRRTRLLFITTTLLLQSLMNDPSYLRRFSHVLLDEVHERSIDLDLLLLVLRLQLARKLSDFRIVIMSATLQPDAFHRYFQGEEDTQNKTREAPQAQVCFAGGGRYTLDILYLDDLVGLASAVMSPELAVSVIDVLRAKSGLSLSAPGLRALGSGLDTFGSAMGSAEQSATAAQLAEAGGVLGESAEAELWRATATDEAPCRPKGFALFIMEVILILGAPGESVLLFLPGAAEVSDIFGCLAVLERPEDERIAAGLPGPRRESCNYRVLVLDSSAPLEDQEEALQHPPIGTCHVLLTSSNAESSMTAPKVRVVLDFCLRRTLSRDRSLHGLCRFKTQWVSRATASQRSGRAGRVVPGIALRMVPRSFHASVMPHRDPPEAEQAPLEKLYLKVKQLSQHIRERLPRIGALPARLLLQQMMHPPPVGQLDDAIASLANLGAITTETDDTAQITILGQMVVALPLDIRLCRLVLFGVLFGCTADVVAMAAGLVCPDPFALPAGSAARDHASCVRALLLSAKSRWRFDGGELSEPLMLRNVFVEWLCRLEDLGDGPSTAAATKEFGRRHAVAPQRLALMVLAVGEIARRTLEFLPADCTATMSTPTVTQGSPTLTPKARSEGRGAVRPRVAGKSPGRAQLEVLLGRIVSSMSAGQSPPKKPHPPPATPILKIDELFCSDTLVLKATLAAAFAPLYARGVVRCVDYHPLPKGLHPSLRCLRSPAIATAVDTASSASIEGNDPCGDRALGVVCEDGSSAAQAESADVVADPLLSQLYKQMLRHGDRLGAPRDFFCLPHLAEPFQLNLKAFAESLRACVEGGGAAVKLKSVDIVEGREAFVCLENGADALSEEDDARRVEEDGEDELLALLSAADGLTNAEREFLRTLLEEVVEEQPVLECADSSSEEEAPPQSDSSSAESAIQSADIERHSHSGNPASTKRASTTACAIAQESERSSLGKKKKTRESFANRKHNGSHDDAENGQSNSEGSGKEPVNSMKVARGKHRRRAHARQERHPRSGSLEEEKSSNAKSNDKATDHTHVQERVKDRIGKGTNKDKVKIRSRSRKNVREHKVRRRSKSRSQSCRDAHRRAAAAATLSAVTSGSTDIAASMRIRSWGRAAPNSDSLVSEDFACEGGALADPKLGTRHSGESSNVNHRKRHMDVACMGDTVEKGLEDVELKRAKREALEVLESAEVGRTLKQEEQEQKAEKAGGEEEEAEKEDEGTKMEEGIEGFFVDFMTELDGLAGEPKVQEAAGGSKAQVDNTFQDFLREIDRIGPGPQPAKLRFDPSRGGGGAWVVTIAAGTTDACVDGAVERSFGLWGSPGGGVVAARRAAIRFCEKLGRGSGGGVRLVGICEEKEAEAATGLLAPQLRPLYPGRAVSQAMRLLQQYAGGRASCMWPLQMQISAAVGANAADVTLPAAPDQHFELHVPQHPFQLEWRLQLAPELPLLGGSVASASSPQHLIGHTGPWTPVGALISYPPRAVLARHERAMKAELGSSEIDESEGPKPPRPGGTDPGAWARRLERLAVFCGMTSRACGEAQQSDCWHYQAGQQTQLLQGLTLLPNLDRSNVMSVLLILAFSCPRNTRNGGVCSVLADLDNPSVRAVSFLDRSGSQRWDVPIWGRGRLSLRDLRRVNLLRYAVSSAMVGSSRNDETDAMQGFAPGALEEKTMNDTDVEEKDGANRPSCPVVRPENRDSDMICEAPEVLEALGRLLADVGSSTGTAVFEDEEEEEQEEGKDDKDPCALVGEEGGLEMEAGEHGAGLTLDEVAEVPAARLGTMWLDIEETFASTSSGDNGTGAPPGSRSASTSGSFFSFDGPLGPEEGEDASSMDAAVAGTASISLQTQPCCYELLPQLTLPNRLLAWHKRLKRVGERARRLVALSRHAVRKVERTVRGMRDVARSVDAAMEQARCAWELGSEASEPTIAVQARDRANQLQHEVHRAFAELVDAFRQVEDIYRAAEERECRTTEAAAAANGPESRPWVAAVQATTAARSRLSCQWGTASSLLQRAGVSHRTATSKAVEAAALAQDKLQRWDEEQRVAEETLRQKALRKQQAARQQAAVRRERAAEQEEHVRQDDALRWQEETLRQQEALQVAMPCLEASGQQDEMPERRLASPLHREPPPPPPEDVPPPVPALLAVPALPPGPVPSAAPWEQFVPPAPLQDTPPLEDQSPPLPPPPPSDDEGRVSVPMFLLSPLPVEVVSQQHVSLPPQHAVDGWQPTAVLPQTLRPRQAAQPVALVDEAPLQTAPEPHTASACLWTSPMPVPSLHAMAQQLHLLRQQNEQLLAQQGGGTLSQSMLAEVNVEALQQGVDGNGRGAALVPQQWPLRSATPLGPRG